MPANSTQSNHKKSDRHKVRNVTMITTTAATIIKSWKEGYLKKKINVLKDKRYGNVPD